MSTKNRFKRTRLLAVGLLLILVVTTLGLHILRHRNDVSTELSRRYDDRATRVESVDLALDGVSRLIHGGGNWRNLPFQLEPGEEAAANQCVAVAKRIRQRVNGVTEFSREPTRTELEEVLAGHPDLFYAKFLLGAWCRMNGHDEEADRLHDAALREAPRIIALQYVTADGLPVRGLAIQTLALECNRVQNGSLDPSLELLYPHLTTDSEGYVYLPVYETVYRTDEMAHPAGYDVAYPSLGWFESRTRIGVLPPVIVTPTADQAML